MDSLDIFLLAVPSAFLVHEFLKLGRPSKASPHTLNRIEGATITTERLQRCYSQQSSRSTSIRMLNGEVPYLHYLEGESFGSMIKESCSHYFSSVSNTTIETISCLELNSDDLVWTDDQSIHLTDPTSTSSSTDSTPLFKTAVNHVPAASLALVACKSLIVYRPQFGPPRPVIVSIPLAKNVEVYLSLSHFQGLLEAFTASARLFAIFEREQEAALALHTVNAPYIPYSVSRVPYGPARKPEYMGIPALTFIPSPKTTIQKATLPVLNIENILDFSNFSIGLFVEWEQDEYELLRLEIWKAESGSLALTLWKPFSISVVLLDLSHPQLDDVEEENLEICQESEDIQKEREYILENPEELAHAAKHILDHVQNENDCSEEANRFSYESDEDFNEEDSSNLGSSDDFGLPTELPAFMRNRLEMIAQADPSFMRKEQAAFDIIFSPEQLTKSATEDAAISYASSVNKASYCSGSLNKTDTSCSSPSNEKETSVNKDVEEVVQDEDELLDRELENDEGTGIEGDDYDLDDEDLASDGKGSDSEEDGSEDDEDDASSHDDEHADRNEEHDEGSELPSTVDLQRQLETAQREIKKLNRLAYRTTMNVSELEDEVEKKDQQNLLLRKKVLEARKEKAHFQELAIQGQSELEQKNKELAILEKEMEPTKKLTKEFVEATKINRKQSEDQEKKADLEIERLEWELKQLREESKAEITKAEEERAFLHQEVQTYRNCFGDDERFKVFVKALQEENARVTKKNEILEKKVDDAMKDIEDMLHLEENRKSAIGDIQNGYIVVNTQYQEARHEIQKLAEALKECQEDLMSSRSLVKDMAKLLRDIPSEAVHFLAEQSEARVDAEIKARDQISEMKQQVLKLKMELEEKDEKISNLVDEESKMLMKEETAQAAQPGLLRKIAVIENELRIKAAKIATLEHEKLQSLRINTTRDTDIIAKQYIRIQALEKTTSELRGRQLPLENAVTTLQTEKAVLKQHCDHEISKANYGREFYSNMFYHEAVPEHDRLLKKIVELQEKCGEPSWAPIEQTNNVKYPDALDRNIHRVARQNGIQIEDDVYPNEGKEGKGYLPADIDIIRKMGGPFRLIYEKGLPYVKRYPERFTLYDAHLLVLERQVFNMGADTGFGMRAPVPGQDNKPTTISIGDV